MSLIKKADVKRHRSTRTTGKLLLFRPHSQSDATGYSNDEIRDAEVVVQSSSARPGERSSTLPTRKT